MEHVEFKDYNVVVIIISSRPMNNTASPLLKQFGGDESGPQVAVPHTLGLPPRVVILGHDLQDVSPLKRKSRLLTRCGFVL